MKRVCIAAAALLAGQVFAAGQFDGIYQSAADSSLYLSVHASGSTLIVASFFSDFTPPVMVVSTDVGKIIPKQLNTWELFQGTLNITTGAAVVSGEEVFNACKTSYNIAFSASSLTVNQNSAAATPLGVSQGANCGSLIDGNSTYSFVKIL